MKTAVVFNPLRPFIPRPSPVIPILSSSPILVIDSGLGGLTVVRALQKTLPREEIVYFGDTARLPYGSKSADTVTTFVRQIIEYALPLRPKHVVIACNTATALALTALRPLFPGLNISGVIEPGARAAIEAAGAKEQPIIGIIATEATVHSKAYDRAILRRRNHARVLLRPSPLLVPIIEEGRTLDDPLVKLALKQYLYPLLKRNIDVLVLGCTHYPILKPVIQQIVGNAVRVIDSAERCADDVARRLTTAGLLRNEPTVQSGFSAEAVALDALGATRAALRCFVTDNAPRFKLLATRFLGVEIDEPTLVSPDDLYAPPVASRPIRQAG